MLIQSTFIKYNIEFGLYRGLYIGKDIKLNKNNKE